MRDASYRSLSEAEGRVAGFGIRVASCGLQIAGSDKVVSPPLTPAGAIRIKERVHTYLFLFMAGRYNRKLLIINVLQSV